MKTPILGVLMTLLWSPRELDSSGSSLPAYPHADFGALGREEQFLLGGQTVASWELPFGRRPRLADERKSRSGTLLEIERVVPT